MYDTVLAPLFKLESYVHAGRIFDRMVPNYVKAKFHLIGSELESVPDVSILLVLLGND